MAPTPPNVRSAPGNPGRSSTFRSRTHEGGPSQEAPFARNQPRLAREGTTSVVHGDPIAGRGRRRCRRGRTRRRVREHAVTAARRRVREAGAGAAEDRAALLLVLVGAVAGA